MSLLAFIVGSIALFSAEAANRDGAQLIVHKVRTYFFELNHVAERLIHPHFRYRY